MPHHLAAIAHASLENGRIVERAPTPGAPAIEGSVHCPDHRAIANADGRRNERRRKEAGKCVKCSAAAVPARSLCARHMEPARVGSARRCRRRVLMLLA